MSGMGRRYGPVHTFLAGTLSSDIFWSAYRLWVWTPPFQYEMPKLDTYALVRSRSHDYRSIVKLARRRRRGLCTLLWSLIYNCCRVFGRISVQVVRHTYLCFTIVQCTTYQPGLVHSVGIYQEKSLNRDPLLLPIFWLDNVLLSFR